MQPSHSSHNVPTIIAQFAVADSPFCVSWVVWFRWVGRSVVRDWHGKIWRTNILRTKRKNKKKKITKTNNHLIIYGILVDCCCAPSRSALLCVCVSRILFFIAALVIEFLFLYTNIFSILLVRINFIERKLAINANKSCSQMILFYFSPLSVCRSQFMQFMNHCAHDDTDGPSI